MSRTMTRWTIAGMLLILFALLSGCSTLPVSAPDSQPPLRRYEDLVKLPPGQQPMLAVSDPIQGFNRGAYRFNYYFDKYLFLPVVNGYRFIMPDYAEKRVSNFYDNIYEIETFTNSLLQLKFKKTGITTTRFVVNSTVGIAGLWDPATSMGLHRQEEDFGQTLGHYGVGNGPYIMLPVAGPSNVRDTTGLVVDSVVMNAIDPLNFDHNEEYEVPFNVLYAVDKRKRIPFRYYGTGSPFEYELVRMLNTQYRAFMVED
ncbi:MAG TPA: VacJ family lipoprotein [Desulfuromonadales bacterium]